MKLQRTFNSLMIGVVLLFIVGLTPFYAPRVKLHSRDNPVLNQDWRNPEAGASPGANNPFAELAAKVPDNRTNSPGTAVARLAKSVNLNWYNLSKLAVLKGLFFTLFIGLGAGALIMLGGIVLGVFLGSLGYVHHAQRSVGHVHGFLKATDIIPRYFIVIILFQFGRNFPEAWKFITYLLVLAVVQLPEAAQIVELETRQVCQRPFFTMALTIGVTLRRLIRNYILTLSQPRYVTQFLKYVLYTLFVESALSFLQIGFTLDNFFRYKVYSLGYILGRLLRENLDYYNFPAGFPVVLITVLILIIVVSLNTVLARRGAYE